MSFSYMIFLSLLISTPLCHSLPSSSLQSFCPLFHPNGEILLVNEETSHLISFVSLTECALECFSHPSWCKGLTYNEEESICKLHTVAISSENVNTTLSPQSSLSYSMGVPEIFEERTLNECTLAFTLNGLRYKNCAPFMNSVCQRNICPIMSPDYKGYVGCTITPVDDIMTSQTMTVQSVTQGISMYTNRWLWIQIFFNWNVNEYGNVKNWTGCKNGFSLGYAYWFGNVFLNQITSNQIDVIDSNTRILRNEATTNVSHENENTVWRLKVEMMDLNDFWYTAEYDCFFVGNLQSYFEVEISGYLNNMSDVGDGFQPIDYTEDCQKCQAPCYRARFSTFDNHIFMYKGSIQFNGWWYTVNNSPFLNSQSQCMGVLSSHEGWWPMKNMSKMALKYSRMDIARYSSFE